MSEDISLKSFTSVDSADDVGTYVRALVAFDSIAQLQELKAAERALVRPSMHVLDVGCGFGLETLRLARLVGVGGTVEGVDKSADFVAEARRRAEAEGLAATFRTGDAAALPYPDRRFDHVRAERLLIYLEDPAQAVAEMKRVARLGATLAFIEPEFASTTVNVSDTAVLRRVAAHEADTAVTHSRLPGTLAGILEDANLTDIGIATRMLIFPRDLGAEYFSAIGRSAARDGAITDGDLERWLADIADLSARDRLFGTIGYFLFTARVAAA